MGKKKKNSKEMNENWRMSKQNSQSSWAPQLFSEFGASNPNLPRWRQSTMLENYMDPEI